MIGSLLLILTCASTFCYGYSEHGASTITWLTNYEEASNKARESSLPLFIFFTGSDWCSWCTKLYEEVLDTPEFADAVGKKFVFLKVDFPRNSYQDPNLKQQNKQLQTKFNIRSFPSVILFDQKQQQQIGSTGYRPGGPRAYAAHLLKMVDDYQNYTQKMQKLSKLSSEEQKDSGIDLKQLYEKSRALGLANDLNRLIKWGCNSDQKPYFQLEHYRLLAEEGLIHSPEATALRQKILAEDPNNELKSHYQVAIIEFEAFSEDGKDLLNPDQTVAPLVSYLEKFGKQDKENLWRLNMIISQVYLDQNKLAQALRYAQSCYDNAPATVQPEIATAIKNIQAQAH
jgi:protein disulfide-isomerase